MYSRLVAIFSVLLVAPLRCNAVNTRLFATTNGHLVDARIDPIVNRNTCSGHVHSVYGNRKFDERVNKNDVTDSNWRDDTGKEDQTTSNIIPNLSMYWAPSMYIYFPPNETYHLVPSFSRSYYRAFHPPGNFTAIHPFPPFMRFVVGDASRKTPWGAAEVHDDIRWTLTTHNRVTTNSIDHGDWLYLRDEPELPNRQELEMNVNFPDCLRLNNQGAPARTSPNYRIHGEYSKPPSQTDYDDPNAYCNPITYPYQVARLTLEVRYRIGEMRDVLGADVVNDIDNWYLSTGDNTGAGAHADFVNGWPTELMENIIVNCSKAKARNPGDFCYIEDTKYWDRVVVMAEKQVPYDRWVPDEEIRVVKELPNATFPCVMGPPTMEDNVWS